MSLWLNGSAWNVLEITARDETKEETVWIKYTRLWETMQRKGISQYRLIKTYGISNGQLNRLRKNLYISTHTVETLCRILDCRVEDVMEIVFDESDELLWSPGLEEERQKQEELEKKKKRQGQ